MKVEKTSFEVDAVWKNSA